MKYSLTAEVPALIVFAAATYTFIRLFIFFDNPVYADEEEIFTFTKQAAGMISMIGFLGILSTIYLWL
ncbi:hypothetical protein [Clostridium sp. 001]|uniref:hypothetical protein n=1 Tax=Clostridium sp. 001 TaxID=1970093 RepID=UPI001C2C5587|nr:hypothetical protein [Clostridium sp. 001]QXE18588.1 hypothetical protein B5S50_06930 [Clostridium sp. 001]